MRTARVFQEPDGFHYCDADLPYLDARSRAFPTRTEALRAAYRAGFTHAMTGDRRRTIPGAIALGTWDHAEHRRSQEVVA